MMVIGGGDNMTSDISDISDISGIDDISDIKFNICIDKPLQLLKFMCTIMLRRWHFDTNKFQVSRRFIFIGGLSCLNHFLEKKDF